MPVPAATSILARHLEAGVFMVRDAPTFRTLVGASNESEARARVHVPYASDLLDDDTQLPVHPKPRGIVAPCANFGYYRIGPAEWRAMGDVWIAFEFPPPEEHKGYRDEELMWFLNVSGAIIEEMAVLVENGSGLYPNVEKFRLEDGPGECQMEDEKGEVFYGIVWQSTWV